MLQQRLETLDSQVKTRVDWPDPRAGPTEKGAEITQDLIELAVSYFDKSRDWVESFESMIFFFNWILGSEPQEQSHSYNEIKKESSLDGGVGPKDQRTSKERVATMWGRYVALVYKDEDGLYGDANLEAILKYANRCNTMKVRNIVSYYFSNADTMRAELIQQFTRYHHQCHGKCARGFDSGMSRASHSEQNLSLESPR